LVCVEGAELPDSDEDDLDNNSVDPELNDWGDSGSGWSDDEDDRPKEVEPIRDNESNQRKVGERVRTTKRGVDVFLDGILSRATGTAERSKEKLEEYAPKLKHRAKKAVSTTRSTLDKMDRLGDKYSGKIFTKGIFDSIISFIVRKPTLIISIILLLTFGMIIWGIIGIPPKWDSEGQLETKLQENIRGDFEVYLPQDHETKLILDEIQKDWSTDIIIAFVETPNSLSPSNPNWDPNANITNISVLNEMSRFEEDFDHKKEEGKNDDGIVFLLSFSTLVKEINSTPPRLEKALKEESRFAEFLPKDTFFEGGYSIPNDEDIVETIFKQIPEESRNKVILDSNDDSIFDTGIILIGITQDIDQEQLVKDMENFVKDFKHCKITLTGPIPMTQAITKRTYSEFTKTLPAAIILVAGILILFHRTWKIVVIAGVPVLCSLAITFGLLGGLDMTLTPQVVLIAPILIALGVAYGLYIANRYSDEAQIEDREERISVAVKTTGKAIFLSALTTAIGFASLLTVSMIPLQVLGFGLSTGIMICYAVTMLTVPSLVMALDYHKKGEIKIKEKIGNVPVVHRKKILGVAIVLVVISVILIPSVQANMNFIKMAPQDEPVILKMREYSDKFGGGQQGMLIVKGVSPYGNNVKGSMKDPDILYEIDRLEIEINKVENTNAISIVDFLKMIKIPEEVEDYPMLQPWLDALELLGIQYNVSFYELIQSDSPLPDGVKVSLINVFYNTLSTEIRGMFISSDYAKTLLYIDMPTMDVVNTKKAVTEVNQITEDYTAGKKTTHLTGFGAILVAVNDILVINSIQSTIIALVLVLIVLALIFKSVKFAAITLIPVCFVVILQPLTLISIGGLGGIINPGDPLFSGELNLFTAVIGSIIVGIGIDFGIHMTERIREHGFNLDGVRHGVSTSGMAFVEATVTMIGGLSAVFLINIPAIQEFILLVMILLTYSVLGALFVLTAIYTIIIQNKEAKERRMRESEEMDKFEKDNIPSVPSVKSEKLPMKASVDSYDR
jgi:predicted RND superfamily exporter protein